MRHADSEERVEELLHWRALRTRFNGTQGRLNRDLIVQTISKLLPCRSETSPLYSLSRSDLFDAFGASYLQSGQVACRGTTALVFAHDRPIARSGTSLGCLAPMGSVASRACLGGNCDRRRSASKGAAPLSRGLDRDANCRGDCWDALRHGHGRRRSHSLSRRVPDPRCHSSNPPSPFSTLIVQGAF